MQDRQQNPTRRTVWTVALSLLLVALAGCAAEEGAAVTSEGAAVATNPANPAGETHANNPAAATVEMTNDLRFSPETVRIQSGETVTWRNTSDVVHTVTADKELAGDPSHVQLPEGAEPFNSGNIQPGESFSKTFDVPGTYRYFCIPHEMQGMVGTVVVE